MRSADYQAKDFKLEGDAQRLLVDLPFEEVLKLQELRALCERFPSYGGHGKAELAVALGPFGMSMATFYRYRARYEAKRTLSSLHVAPRVGNRPKRIPRDIEKVMSDEIAACLKRGTRSPKAIWEDVAGACYDAGFKAPSISTVRRRVGALTESDIVEKALGKAKARKYLGCTPGQTPRQSIPLARVQIDHTLADIVCVNRINGLPVGRPWISMAIDEASKAVVGMMLGYEVPSTASLAKFMSHMVGPKDALLKEIEVDFPWPMHGRPMSIYVDQGSDFTAHAFMEGCREHNIDLEHRPAGKPHYGGLIERLIGTTIGKVKLLKGSTDSVWREYKRSVEISSEAMYSIDDLERELLLWITGDYHQSQRADLDHRTPLDVWCSYMGGVAPPLPKDGHAFFLDFLARGRRRLYNGYVHALGVTYWDDALESLARRNTAKRYEIRFDIHDISRIWLRNPSTGHFIRLRARRRDMGPTSLAEWRAARRQAKAAGMNPRNENDRMRALAAIRRHRLSIPGRQAERVAARHESRTHRALLTAERHGIGYEAERPTSTPSRALPSFSSFEPRLPSPASTETDATARIGRPPSDPEDAEILSWK